MLEKVHESSGLLHMIAVSLQLGFPFLWGGTTFLLFLPSPKCHCISDIKILNKDDPKGAERTLESMDFWHCVVPSIRKRVSEEPGGVQVCTSIFISRTLVGPAISESLLHACA